MLDTYPIGGVTMTDLQITFIIVVPIIILLIAGAILYKPILKKYNQKYFKNSYYKKVYKQTLYGDYFLLNDFLFFHEDNKYTKIDHIMCGEKYIYVINDYYFNGSLVGNELDKSLVLIKNDKNNTKKYVDNPLLDSKIMLKRLSMVTNIDSTMLVGISLVNDDCAIDVAQTSNQFYLIQANKFGKLIKAIESRDISEINQEELQRVVRDLDRLNKKGKKYAKRSVQ